MDAAPVEWRASMSMKLNLLKEVAHSFDAAVATTQTVNSWDQKMIDDGCAHCLNL